MKSKRSLISIILLLFGVLVLVNLLSREFFVRADLTADNRYTLNEATVRILENIDQPITITAYFSEEMPVQLTKVKRRFREMLAEYESRSDGMISYKFEVPSGDRREMQKLMRKGIRPTIAQVREEGKTVNQRVFLGAELKSGGGQTEVIPIITSETPMEYKLSKKIKKLSVKKKPKVGLLQGHGEASLRQLQKVRKEIGALNQVESVRMSDTTRLSQYQTLVIIAPTDTIPPTHFRLLDRYLQQGGNLFVAYSPVKGNMRRMFGTTQETGLTNWLAQKGIRIEKKFLLDQNAVQVMARQPQGGAAVVQFPFYPAITNFEKHPITEGIEQLTLEFTTPISVSPIDTSINYTVLAKTSSKTGTKTPPTRFQVFKRWGDSDFPESHKPIAVAAEGKFGGQVLSKLVVISNSGFAVGKGRRQQPNENNVNFMANSIDWLSDQTGLMALRTQGAKTRPIKADLEQSTQSWLAYLNFLGPILLVVLIGVARRYYNRQRRLKWMAVDYV